MASSDQDHMARYQEYLARNYEGGADRFFSPTGFLDDFQRTVEVKAQAARSHVFVRSMDEAESFLQPVVTGGEGVYDLTAEPGTGKTSVLPFRFPTKKIIVALPVPFDAWSAFNMATGKCQLKLKGLTLGPESNVIYTDSYLAAKALLSGYMDYDIMLVDECDSDKGVTRFLAEVKAPGKLLIRMSASLGATAGAVSTSYQVTDVEDMPDIRSDEEGFSSYVTRKSKSRSLVLAPDASAAKRVHEKIPGSVLVTPESPLADIARNVLDQKTKTVYVSDSACGKSLSLNLDFVFDSQLVTEYGATRLLTAGEKYQRRGRLGRNKPGFYYSPGLPTQDKTTSDIDAVRHNVARGIACVPQKGSARLHVTEAQAWTLMKAQQEPYMELDVLRRREDREAAVSSDSDEGARSSRSTKVRSSPATSISSGSQPKALAVLPPKWLYYFSGSKPAGKSTQLVERDDRGMYFVKRPGSGSGSRRSSYSGSALPGSGKEKGWFDVDVTPGASRRHGDDRVVSRSYMESERHLVSPPKGSHRLSRASAASGGSLPYSADRSLVARPAPVRASLPSAPPLMDLTESTYDIDWPSLIRDRLLAGGDLPTLVPPGSWRHTSATGLGTDWMRRLDDMACRDQRFDDEEFEVVCRAWNLLVARSWVRKTPGLSSVSDVDRMEYCARYFQSYFLLGSAQ